MLPAYGKILIALRSFESFAHVLTLANLYITRMSKSSFSEDLVMIVVVVVVVVVLC